MTRTSAVRTTTTVRPVRRGPRRGGAGVLGAGAGAGVRGRRGWPGLLAGRLRG
ncbi:MAG: hypothetical protein ACR2FL_02385 [Nocardioidaceae bacterium]